MEILNDVNVHHVYSLLVKY